MQLPESRYFVPSPRESFALIRFSQAFYQEVSDRKEHQHHCQWYATVAQKHRQEFQNMENDINLLRWFRR